MGSWRENASAEAQQDLDDLLGLVLPFAQRELEKRGEFYPFVGVVQKDGHGSIVATRAADAEHPKSAAVVDECVTTLRHMRREIRAGAVVADVRLPHMGSDGVAVELEHVEGHAITVLLPYRKRRFPRRIDYGEIRAEPGRQRIWVG